MSKSPMTLRGGVDLNSPSPTAPPGTLRDCLNYEVATRDGYTRILGVERFDGGPGVAQFKLVQFGTTGLDGAIEVGDQIDYAGRDGYVIDAVTEAGILYITCAMEGGSYDIEAGGTVTAPSGTAEAATARIVFKPLGTQDALQLALSRLANTRRAQKLPVPGRAESDVLAVFMLRGNTYAVRDLPRAYFSGGYYTDAAEGLYVEIDGQDHRILDVRVTGDNVGYLIYDPVPGAGPMAVPVGSPTISSLPVSGDIEDGYHGVPYSDGLEVSGGVPPYRWSLLEDDEADPPAYADDLSEITFMSDQTPAALWRALEAGGWERVPGGRELQFAEGGELAEINTRALNIDATVPVATAPLAPAVIAANGAAATFPANLGDTAGTTLVVSDFGLGAVLPAGIKVLGLEVEVERSCAQAGRAYDLAVTLLNAPGQADNKAAGFLPTTAAAVTYGGDTDLWGIEGLSRADLVSPDFGVIIAINQDEGEPAADTIIEAVTLTVHYAIDGSTEAYVWNGSADVPITINASLPSGGAADIDTLTGYFHITAAVNADKPRLIDAGDEIRTEPGGGGELIAKVASRDRPVFLPGQLEVDHNRSRYQFEQTNFFGQDKFDAIYGVSGAGPAFCFDGVNVIKIRTPLMPSDDVPRHLARHGDSLMLGFFGGAVLATPPGNPFETRGDKGAVAIEVGDRIMGLVPMSGDALGILCQSKSELLRGLTEESYFRSKLSAKRGALEYTAADMGAVVVADSFGLFLADSPESYAPANRKYLSTNVEDWLRTRLQATLNTEQRFLRPVAALAVRAKNQYRLFFSDGYILTMTQKDSPEFTFQRYYAPAPDAYTTDTPWMVRALASGIDASGRERLFCSFSGLKSGYVFEIEGGNTLDGAGIPHFIELNPVTPNGGSHFSRYDRLFIYGAGQGYAPISMTRSVDYLQAEDENGIAITMGRRSRRAVLDAHPIKGKVDNPIEGEELSLKFYGVSGSDAPHTLQHLELYIDDRGASRGAIGE